MEINDEDDQDIKAMYTAIQGFSQSLLVKMQADPLQLAAVLASTALSIYKTTLNDEDFDSIVEAIADSRDSVKPFGAIGEETIH